MNAKREKNQATGLLFLSVGLLIAAVLLAVLLLAPAAEGKSASVLLQEGLYEEDVKGDLDAAIEIYKKAAVEGVRSEKTAARAMYRIGMCYRKKGKKEEAADYFEQVTSRFPQQKALVARAQKQLAKLRPPVNQTTGFGPERRVTLYDIDHGTGRIKNCLIDFDTGRVFRIPAEVIEMVEGGDGSGTEWLVDSGADAAVKMEMRDMDGPGVIAFAMAVEMVPAFTLDKIGPAELQSLMFGKRSEGHEGTPIPYESSKSQPVFAFRTREGKLGVLQLISVEPAARKVEFRYKMLQKGAGVEPVAPSVGFGPVIERIVNDDSEEENMFIDFDSGQLFTPPRSMKGSDKENIFRWVAENGIDAITESKPSSPGLYGFDMAVIPLANERWEGISAGGLAEELSIAKRGTPAAMSAKGDLPATFMIKTREGGMGVVQIIEMVTNVRPRHFKIRYKMVQEGVPYDDLAGDVEQMDRIIGQWFEYCRKDDPIKAIELWHGGKDPGDIYIETRRFLGMQSDWAFEGTLEAIFFNGNKATVMSMGNARLDKGFGERSAITFEMIKTDQGQWKIKNTGFRPLRKWHFSDKPFMLEQYPHAQVWQRKAEPTMAGGPDLVKAKAMVPTINAMASSIRGAVDDRQDAETGLLLVNKFIELGKQFQTLVKGTAAEGSGKVFFDMLIPLREALEKKDLERTMALFRTLDDLGDAVDEGLSATEDVTKEEALLFARRRQEELHERSQSLERLSSLGKSLVIYANDDEKGRYPDTLDGLTNLHRMKKSDYEWIMKLVEYLGKGKTMADDPGTVIAYDKSLLQTGKGTNVLFNDTHVEFVEPERFRKLGIKATRGGVATFKATIHDNMGLDLDTGASVPLKVSREITATSSGVLVVSHAPEGVDVAWDNDGGGALMVVPGSGARIIALPSATNQQQAINSTRASMDLLRKSESKGLLANQSKFVAVLTDKGKLAVIEITSYAPEKGLIEWRLEEVMAPVSEYSVKERRKIWLPDADTQDVNAILDLASGEKLRAGTGEQQLTVLRDLGKGDLAWDRSLICLRGAIAKAINNDGLEDMIILEQIEDITAYELPPVPCRVEVTTAEGDRYEVTVRNADDNGINLEYGKIESGAKELSLKHIKAKDEESLRRLESMNNLHQLGLALKIYSDDHNNKMPDDLSKIEAYMPDDKFLRWIGENVEYVAKGASVNQRRGGSIVVAYDKTLLDKGKGTNVLFLDYSVRFVLRNELVGLGIKSREPSAGLGPVIERVIGEDSTVIDFETGKVLEIPRMLRNGPGEVIQQWVVDNGIDAGRDQEIIVIDMAGERLLSEAWSQISAGELKAVVQDANTVKGQVIMPSSGQYPPTYAFRTREGGIGILQILDVTDEGTKIQYKMASGDASTIEAVDADSVEKWKMGGLAEMAAAFRQERVAEHNKLAADRRAQLEKDIRTVREMDKPKAVSGEDKRVAEELSAEGWKLWGQRKLGEAEKLFEQAVDKDPGNANAWNGLGWSQFNQGKNLNAKHSFEKCLEIEPKHAAALNGLGWIAKAANKVDEAIGHWEKAIKAAPTATASLNGLAMTYMERKEYDKAIKYYRMWLDAEPGNGDAKAGLEKAKNDSR